KAGSQPWDRKLHAQLLNKVADGGAALVAMDIVFGKPLDEAGDEALAAALRRASKGVLAAQQAGVGNTKIAGGPPPFPDELFLNAARTNWGVAWFYGDLDFIVRKHWPFPSPGPSTHSDYRSLPWAAATLAGAKLDNNEPRERWLRYYHEGAWTRISYR